MRTFSQTLCSCKTITEEGIIQFLKEETCEDKITSDTDVFNDCFVSGDDCDELLEAIKKSIILICLHIYGVFIMKKEVGIV